MIAVLFYISLTTETIEYGNVKPIFETRCAQCHNANWPAKNWLDEKIAKDNAFAIRNRVDNRSMPPNNISNLTTAERQQIINWANNIIKRKK